MTLPLLTVDSSFENLEQKESYKEYLKQKYLVQVRKELGAFRRRGSATKRDTKDKGFKTGATAQSTRLGRFQRKRN
jgi:hypothetical protein